MFARLSVNPEGGGKELKQVTVKSSKDKKKNKFKKRVSFSENLESVKPSSIDSKDDDQDLMDIFGAGIQKLSTKDGSKESSQKLLDMDELGMDLGILAPIQEEESIHESKDDIFGGKDDLDDLFGNMGDFDMSGIGGEEEEVKP